MIENLNEYFLPEYEFYLESISYSKLEDGNSEIQHTLNCSDDLKADIINDEQVKLTVTRALDFDTEDIFTLSVAFGALLKFEPEKKHEYHWDEMSLEDEFKLNGGFVINNLLSRISLLISQITSSFGQTPIVLPPVIPDNN